MSRVEYIKDITGANYLGINIYTERVHLFLDKMEKILGEDYEEYVKNQQDRDRGHYHCTVLNVADFNRIEKDIKPFDVTDFKLIGLGTAENKGNKTFFVVCQSEQLNKFRESLGKNPSDFHITLGFKHKDVFGVRKNETI